MKAVIYSKSDCPFCEKAKDWLNDNLIDWSAVVFDDFLERQVMYDSLGLKGDERRVPQIIVVDEDGNEVEHIRGYNALIESGLEYRAATTF